MGVMVMVALGVCACVCVCVHVCFALYHGRRAASEWASHTQPHASGDPGTN